MGMVWHCLAMETNEISAHEVRVFLFLKDSGRWVTAKETAKNASVAPRTARFHLLKLSRLGLLDSAEVYPGHRYRLSDKAPKRNPAYFARIIKAAEIFRLGV